MTKYQPVHDFSPGVRIAFSKSSDGSMAAGLGANATEQQQENADRFIDSQGFARARYRMFITYEPENTYTHIERREVQGDELVRCDALYTTNKNIPLTLPVADCIGTVIHDPVTNMLAILHLGRHSSVAGLIEEFADVVSKSIGSKPENWHIWMSPSLQAESNSLEYFDPPYPEHWLAYQKIKDDGKIHIDIPGHNRDRFERLGVLSKNIYLSPVDTYTDQHYFSHRAATEGAQPERQGRMVIVASMQ